ncbi:hypothetical protein PAN31117_00082 [Pandoraea anapnoica]|uniref:Aspartyl protease n=1 Tax=Pandoraea anapnoica TaxID=2508301 RepID=A0A5E4ZHE2_9BURK|nr:hypothetical protein [Pandoraea anapnoica]VVE59962.1 hypothetical protein PAN31117_00082 [Pandoraea anapnoica]
MPAKQLAQFVFSSLLSLICSLPQFAYASSARCSDMWPIVRPVFASTIQYGNAERKSDPFITVSINNQPARMLLDSGSNRHVIWDPRFVSKGAAPNTGSHVLNAIASSAPARQRVIELEDDERRSTVQTIYEIDETPLMAEGFSGIISPQYLAGGHVSVMNFKDDCFFVGRRFEPEVLGKIRVDDGSALPNIHHVMAIPVGFKAARIPMLVDSGAYATTLPLSMISGEAVGEARRRSVDLLGREIESDGRLRLVDLTINGQLISRHPVASQDVPRQGGVASLGAIGMAVLKNRIVFYDNERHRFALLVPWAKADTER